MYLKKPERAPKSNSLKNTLMHNYEDLWISETVSWNYLY